MQTGENEQALRKILDMTRRISIALLVLHFYYYCYTVFEQWHLTVTLTDRLMGNIRNTGLFNKFNTSKLFALGFLTISLMGAKGRKDEKLNYKTAFACIIIGLLIYFLSYFSLLLTVALTTAGMLYIGITAIGFMLVLSGGTLLSRVIQQKLNSKDISTYIPMQGDLRDKYNIFKNEALKLTGVQSISAISNNPSNSDQQTNGVDWDGRNPNTLISVEHPNVDYDFVQTMKLQLAAGRDFSKDFSAKENGFLLNETAVKVIGYKNAVGRFITVNGRRASITGVLKDFNFRSLHEPIQPMIIELNAYVNYMLLRIDGNKTKAALAGIEKLCKELNPAFPFTYSFSDEEYQKLYQNEQVIGKLFNAFAGLAIFISCLGLLGLIMFTAEQRTKEIGIRKVLGASVKNILHLLSADLLLLVFIAILIASPIAWWAMHNWLNDYAYKINISGWMFAAAAGIIVLITICTISFQAIKAAIANPVKSLRTE